MFEFVKRRAIDVHATLPHCLQSICTHIVSTILLTYLLINAAWHSIKNSLEKHGVLKYVLSWLPTNWVASWLRGGPSKSESTSLAVYDYVMKHPGYGCEDFITVTDDGYHLLIHRIYRRCRKNGREPPSKPFPILLQHGLFQSAGVFVTSGRQSLAFYLVDQGYDVWLGNNRGVPCDSKSTPLCRTKRLKYVDGHKKHPEDSHLYWDWTIDDMAMFDFPCLVDFVLKKTKRSQLHYVGHSQGNAQAFICLSGHEKRHQYHQKLRSFTALAPAVILGPLINRYPLNRILQMIEPDAHDMFSFLFGQRQFLPIMSLAQYILPDWMFGEMAYGMFSYLFDWHDDNWNRERKIHYFRFTPRPVSSKVILQWGKIAKEGSIAPFPDRRVIPRHRSNSASRRSSGERKTRSQSCEHTDSIVICDDTIVGEVYDLAEAAALPLIIVWGDKDHLVDGEKLVQYFQSKDKHDFILWKDCIPGYEHLDFLWAQDAQDKVWDKMISAWDRLDTE